jgi:hypothetical protein
MNAVSLMIADLLERQQFAPQAPVAMQTKN